MRTWCQLHLLHVPVPRVTSSPTVAECKLRKRLRRSHPSKVHLHPDAYKTYTMHIDDVWRWVAQQR